MKKTTETINAKYEANSTDIARLIDFLQMELDNHAAAPRNWGKVADLGKVRSDLMELVAFISGSETQQVADLLSEISEDIEKK